MPEDQRAYWRRRLLERRRWFYFVGCGVLTFGLVHYVTHISETPVTHRRRYLAFTKEQFLKLAEFMYNLVMMLLSSFSSSSMFVLIHRVSKKTVPLLFFE